MVRLFQLALATAIAAFMLHSFAPLFTSLAAIGAALQIGG